MLAVSLELIHMNKNMLRVDVVAICSLAFLLDFLFLLAVAVNCSCWLLLFLLLLLCFVLLHLFFLSLFVVSFFLSFFRIWCYTSASFVLLFANCHDSWRWAAWTLPNHAKCCYHAHLVLTSIMTCQLLYQMSWRYLSHDLLHHYYCKIACGSDSDILAQVCC